MYTDSGRRSHSNFLPSANQLQQLRGTSAGGGGWLIFRKVAVNLQHKEQAMLGKIIKANERN